MSENYVGIDLHTKSSQLGVIDHQGQPVAEAKLPNDLSQILTFLQPYGPRLPIAIESTLNWYWLVDGLQLAGHQVQLVHTLGRYMISGAKVKTDRRDAFKLAKLLRLGELPQAYIYPQEKRPLRDLLRRRIGLVQQRAATYTSLRIQLLRYNLNTFSLEQLKQLTSEDLETLPIPEELKAYCLMLIQRQELFSCQITQIDEYLQHLTLDEPGFQRLLTLPGVWYTLALTIYYEIGDIHRFQSAKHFVSYCRLIPGIAQSGNTTKRGRGSKQGNPHLKWAFTQAANIAVRYYPPCQRFRDKHARKRTGNAATMIANCILAHKLASATFHLLTKDTDFEMTQLFN